MIGLSFLLLIIVWTVVALRLTPHVSYFLRTRWWDSPWFAPKYLFPIVMILPIADGLISAVQFKLLCERSAVMEVQPTWQRVTKARKDTQNIYPKWQFITTKGYVANFVDVDTNEIFFSYTYFHRSGKSILRRMLWDSYSNSDFCKHKDAHATYIKLNIDQLLKNGE